MKTKIACSLWIATLIGSGVALSSMADEHKAINNPGYRPDSKLAEEFLQHLNSSRIAVLPTVIRTNMTTTTSSEASQRAIVAFLKEHQLGVPEARKVELKLGKLEGKAQFAFYQGDQMKIGEMVKNQSGADYYMVLECLIPQRPSGKTAIFGLHVYVLNANGENAFSFLLNSHHKIFVDAELNSTNSGEQGNEALVLKGTQAALDALLQQIRQARRSDTR